MKQILIFVLLTITLLPVKAQVVKGTLKNIADEPVQYANLQLLMAGDSTFIAGTVSDKKGNFQLAKPANKELLLKISTVSYQTVWKTIGTKENNKDLGTITLEEDVATLGDVTVTANRVIQKVDRQIVLPGTVEKEAAVSGLQLLANMGLPRLLVDMQNRNISMADGGSVILRINGIPAQINDVVMLRPKDVIRIEYHDMPGVQVQADAIIDFIVRRRETGGYLKAYYNNSIPIKSGLTGNGDLAAKINHKLSEWSLYYTAEHRNYEDRWIENRFTYQTPEGEVTGHTKGVPSPFNYLMQTANLAYNYTKPDKRTFNAIFRGNFFNRFGKDENNTMLSTLTDAILNEKSRSKEFSQSPSLDIYYREFLPKKQMLQVDVVGGLSHTTTYRKHKAELSNEKMADINITDVTGNKYYLIAEANHYKEWEKLMLLTGIKYNYGHTKNEYGGNIKAHTALDNSDLYMYTMLQGRVKKFGYGLGVGASYSYFKGNGKGYKFWTFRPNVMLNYMANRNLSFRYYFFSSPSIPSLSQLSDVEQVQDQFTVLKGNPSLTPYRFYINRLSALFQAKIWQMEVGASHYFAKNPIMSHIYWSDSWGRFISDNLNQSHHQRTSAYVSGGVRLFKNKLHLNAYGEVVHIDSKGNTFRNQRTYLYGYVNASLYIKNWNVTAWFSSRQKNLYANIITYNEWPSFNLSVGYKWKQLNAGVDCYGLFYKSTNYRTVDITEGHKQDWNSYIDGSAPVVKLYLQWEINWGRKSKAARKGINNSDSDNGILKVAY